MRRLLAVLLLVAFVSPLVWMPLLTHSMTVRLVALFIATLLWLGIMRRSKRNSELLLFAGLLLWFEGTLLWLAAPAHATRHALSMVGITCVALVGLLPIARGREDAISMRTHVFAWVGLGLAILINLVGDTRLPPWAWLAMAPLLALPWSLPSCLTALRTERDAFLSTLTTVMVGVIALLAIGGIVQGIRTGDLFDRLSRDRAPWEREWSPEAIEALRERNLRFPQPQGETLIQVTEGLTLLQRGQTTEAMTRLDDALRHDSPTPAAINAVCWAWGQAGLFGPLLDRVSPEQVIAAESPEAAQRYLDALVAAGRVEDAERIHEHFGEAVSFDESVSPPPEGAVFIAGRMFERIGFHPASPEAETPFAAIRPGQSLVLECAWRVTHHSPEGLEIRLRLGEQETRLLRLDSTEALSLGERVTTETRVDIPSLLPTSTERAELILATGFNGYPAQHAVVDLAAVSSDTEPPQVADLPPGIPEEHRLRLFGAQSEALHLSADLQGTTSVFTEVSLRRAAQRIAILSHLSGARQIEHSQAVAEIFLSDQRGTVETLLLLAGRDTADTWSDYPPFQSQMRHGMAPIAWQTPREFNGHRFHNSVFVGEFTLPETMEIRAVRIRSLLPSGTWLHILGVVIVPGETTGIGE
ncbi:hypothetical protein JXA47_04315 [Candidatus Sumerlaeota bacterium]|nr:hypothetical protein [Candidatus Sumerlaeota bacterium]